MEYFIAVVKDNYTNFEGRARRKEYWMFFLFAFIFSTALGIIDGIIGLAPVGVSALFQIAIFVPSIAVGARRLHDVGKSGWWQLLYFVLIIGWIPLIIFLCQDSDIGDNEFGSSEKYPHANDDDDDFILGEEE